jgi:serine/threonine protein kinase
MIHRDIKPANVMFLDNTFSHALLTDFGMARLVDDRRLTMSGAIVGTPAYMSPEATLSQKVDERSDIYSLGVVLYEMLTGAIPYAGDTAFAIMLKITSEPPPLLREVNPDVPESMEWLTHRALAKNREERFQSAAELKAVINQIESGTFTPPSSPPTVENMETLQLMPSLAESVSRPAQPDPPSPKTSPTIKTGPRWLPLGLIGGIILIAALFLFYRFGSANEGIEPNALVAPVTNEDPSLGVLHFSDGSVRASDFSLQVNQIDPPPAGSHYALWLSDEGRENILNVVGELPVTNGRVNFQGRTAQNLLNTYSQALISLEADNDSTTGISEDVVFAGEVSPDLLATIRAILFAAPENQKGFLPGVEEQINIALTHAGFLEDALAANNMAAMRLHTEHLVNILDGESGPNFGDGDGDGRVENPGDGVGIRVYLVSVKEQMAQIAAAQERFPQLSDSLERIRTTTDNNLTVVDESLKKALQILATDTLSEAQPLIDELDQLVNRLTSGTDQDDNGVIDPTRNEGGIPALYDEVLSLGEIPLFPTQ